MDKADRLQQLHRVFLDRRTPIALSIIAEKLECSERQARRLIEVLRDERHAPLIYERSQKGWMYITEDAVELPGLWFTAEELYSLGLFMEMLKNLGTDALVHDLQAIRESLHALLGKKGVSIELFISRIKAFPTCVGINRYNQEHDQSHLFVDSHKR